MAYYSENSVRIRRANKNNKLLLDNNMLHNIIFSILRHRR